MKYFLPALTLLLVALKLTDHIDWSWWWVWAPLWAPAAGLVGLLLVCWVVVWWFETPQERELRRLMKVYRKRASK